MSIFSFLPVIGLISFLYGIYKFFSVFINSRIITTDSLFPLVIGAIL